MPKLMKGKGASDMVMSRVAFLRRLTVDEEAAIDIAAIDAEPQAGTPAEKAAVRRAQAAIRVALRRVSVSPQVNLMDDDIRAAVASFESAGLIAPGRAAQVLDMTNIKPSERPTT